MRNITVNVNRHLLVNTFLLIGAESARAILCDLLVKSDKSVCAYVFVHLSKILDLKLITPLSYQALIQTAFLTKGK